MDSFGILGGLLGGMISSGKFEVITTTVTNKAPFNSAKDIVIVLGYGTIRENSSNGDYTTYSNITLWMVPYQNHDTIQNITVTLTTVTTAATIKTPIIVITEV